jgi:cathepsin L
MFVSSFLALAASSPDLLKGYSFEAYESEFQRKYTVEERPVREAIFLQNLASIIAHNEAPQSSWHRGIGDLTDRTPEEIREILPRGFDKAISVQERLRDGVGQKQSSNKNGARGDVDLPERVDWRELNIITPVKNQGNCGSCWAFASTETIESHAALKRGGRLEEYSEQFILDCTPNPHSCGGTGACEGGTAALAFDSVASPGNGGIPSEWTYPYKSGNNGTAFQCHGTPLVPARPHFGGVSQAANVTGRVAVTSNSYDDVMQAIATVGPMTVTVDAGDWHDYESGIFDGGNHTNPDLDHLVQLVGYGSEHGKDYWLVRNSWTALWGENGYIRLARYGAKGDEPCGVDLTPMDGDGCTGGPATVKVCGTSGVLYDAAYPTIGE